MQNEKEITALRSLIEESAGKKMVSPADFQFLSELIAQRCHETLGITTLKRIWGYIEGYNTIRNSTLSILARVVGFHDWQDFLTNYNNGSESSHIILGEILYAEQISENALVQVCWAPDRKCIFKHISNGNFIVVESINSKLTANDTFHCTFFAKGQPLYIDNFVHDNKAPTLFVVGNKGGLSDIRIL